MSYLGDVAGTTNYITVILYSHYVPHLLSPETFAFTGFSVFYCTIEVQCTILFHCTKYSELRDKFMTECTTETQHFGAMTEDQEMYYIFNSSANMAANLGAYTYKATEIWSSMTSWFSSSLYLSLSSPLYLVRGHGIKVLVSLLLFYYIIILLLYFSHPHDYYCNSYNI